MKPSTRRLVPPALMLAATLAGCGKGGDTPGAVASSPASTSAAAKPRATAAPVGGVARSVANETDAYEFGYDYPAQAAAFPGLKRQLDGELDRTKAEFVSEAEEAQVEANKNGSPFHAYSSGKAWAVVTDLPDWLSLSATISTYTGGAHGMTSFDTLLWDKRADARRHPVDLFASKAAFRAALAKPMCEALNRERAKRREGENYGADDEFSQCIDPVDDAIVILGSGNRQRFDRVGFLVPPYGAGPYVEGSYEVTVPVTPAIIAAVKPEYRAAFTVR